MTSQAPYNLSGQYAVLAYSFRNETVAASKLCTQTSAKAYEVQKETPPTDNQSISAEQEYVKYATIELKEVLRMKDANCNNQQTRNSRRKRVEYYTTTLTNPQVPTVKSNNSSWQREGNALLP